MVVSYLEGSDMAGLFSALNAARTSLEVNQKSIEIVGNNISNVNTEGYSRQEAALTTYPSVNFGDFFVGQGVKIEDVKREHNIFVTNQLREKAVDFGLYNGQTQSLSELERIFNITDENLATDVDRFFDAWQELSASPSDLVLRDTVIQRGELLAVDFNNIMAGLDSVSLNINDSLIAKIEDLNAMFVEVAQLNERIQTIEVSGQMANGARDRRDVLATKLAETLGAESYETPNGNLAIQLPGGLPLVQGNIPMRLEAVSVGATLDINLHAGGAVRTLAQSNLGGEFAGLVDIRDQFIPNLVNDLDRLAYEISSQINTQHAAGAGLDGVTNRDFFSGPRSVPQPPAPPAATWLDAARNMSVVLTDPNQVAAGFDPVTPGDNRNALIISNIGDTYLVNQSDDFNSFYGKMTSRIGIRTNQNDLSLAGAEDAVVQYENLRDGLSGVSLEEEMIDLIVYQRGFESSAKFLSTVDEMMNSLIEI